MATDTSDGYAKYFVIHPLDDAPEQKKTGEGLGPIEMSGTVKAALIVLRGYLLFIVGLAVYRLGMIAVVVTHHAHHV